MTIKEKKLTLRLKEAKSKAKELRKMNQRLAVIHFKMVNEMQKDYKVLASRHQALRDVLFNFRRIGPAPQPSVFLQNEPAA